MGHSFSCRTDILFIITTVMDEKLLNMDVKHSLKKKNLPCFSGPVAKGGYDFTVDCRVKKKPQTCYFSTGVCEVSHSEPLQMSVYHLLLFTLRARLMCENTPGRN